MKEITKVKLPELVITKEKLLYHNNFLKRVYLPKLVKTESEFLTESLALEILIVPNLREIYGKFRPCSENLKEVYIPNLRSSYYEFNMSVNEETKVNLESLILAREVRNTYIRDYVSNNIKLELISRGYSRKLKRWSMNSNRFGENMINYYESSDHYEINELYNKNKLKVKTVVLTDGEVNKNTTIIDYSNGVELNGNKYAVDRVEKSVIECDKANFVILLKLVNLDVMSTKSTVSYFIIKEVDVYLRELNSINIKRVRRIVMNLLKNNLDGVKRVFDIDNVRDYECTSVNEYTYKLTKIK